MIIKNNSDKNELDNQITEQLKTVYDPEIPVDIFELGLIYELHINAQYHVRVIMTLTSPNCPIADSILEEVKTKCSHIKEVKSVEVELTFEPPWSMDMMSLEAKVELGFI